MEVPPVRKHARNSNFTICIGFVSRHAPVVFHKHLHFFGPKFRVLFYCSVFVYKNIFFFLLVNAIYISWY